MYYLYAQFIGLVQCSLAEKTSAKKEKRKPND